MPKLFYNYYTWQIRGVVRDKVLLLWLIICFENEIQYKPGHKLYKPLHIDLATQKSFFLEWNDGYLGSV